MPAENNNLWTVALVLLDLSVKYPRKEHSRRARTVTVVRNRAGEYRVLNLTALTKAFRERDISIYDITEFFTNVIEGEVERIEIGFAVYIEENVKFHGGNVVIGDNCFIGSGVFIGRDVTIRRMTNLEPGCTIGDFVRIHDHGRIGARAEISDDILIRENCVVESGAKIERSLLSNSFVPFEHVVKQPVRTSTHIIKKMSYNLVYLGNDVFKLGCQQKSLKEWLPELDFNKWGLSYDGATQRRHPGAVNTERQLYIAMALHAIRLWAPTKYVEKYKDKFALVSSLKGKEQDGDREETEVGEILEEMAPYLGTTSTNGVPKVGDYVLMKTDIPYGHYSLPDGVVRAVRGTIHFVDSINPHHDRFAYTFKVLQFPSWHFSSQCVDTII